MYVHVTHALSHVAGFFLWCSLLTFHHGGPGSIPEVSVVGPLEKDRDGLGQVSPLLKCFSWPQFYNTTKTAILIIAMFDCKSRLCMVENLCRGIQARFLSSLFYTVACSNTVLSQTPKLTFENPAHPFYWKGVSYYWLVDAVGFVLLSYCSSSFCLG